MDEWRPYPKQEIALTTDSFEILYGGSRGGGKTDAGMVWLLDFYVDKNGELKCYTEHPRYRALVLRKHSNDLSDWLDRASYMYKRYGGEVVGNPPEIRFPSGAKFRTGHLKNRESYEKFLGHEYQRLLIEELNSIPDEKYYQQILGSVRSTVDELDTGVFLTTNPGGVGHQWVKSRFVDPSPPFKVFTSDKTNRTSVYIPATVDDNPAILEKDPAYVDYLDSLKETDEELWKAWRYGDWDVFAGQFFRQFNRRKHVVKRFTPKDQIRYVGSIDWGYSAPFAFYLHIIIPVSLMNGVEFNRVVTFKEFYATERTPKEWAKYIAENVELDKVDYVYCDPAMFHSRTDGGESIADQFKREWLNDGWKLKPASNDRVAGWSRMRDWLSIAPDGKPYWLIAENCVNLIRTLPMQVYDERKPEDIDTLGEDHGVDSCRYALSSIKWVDATEAGIVKSQAGVVNRGVKPAFIDKLDLDKFAKAK